MQAKSTAKEERELVGSARFELTTYGLGNRCSIQLSYDPTGQIFIRQTGGMQGQHNVKLLQQAAMEAPEGVRRQYRYQEHPERERGHMFGLP